MRLQLDGRVTGNSYLAGRRRFGAGDTYPVFLNPQVPEVSPRVGRQFDAQMCRTHTVTVCPWAIVSVIDHAENLL